MTDFWLLANAYAPVLASAGDLGDARAAMLAEAIERLRFDEAAGLLRGLLSVS